MLSIFLPVPPFCLPLLTLLIDPPHLLVSAASLSPVSFRRRPPFYVSRLDDLSIASRGLLPPLLARWLDVMSPWTRFTGGTEHKNHLLFILLLAPHSHSVLITFLAVLLRPASSSKQHNVTIGHRPHT